MKLIRIVSAILASLMLTASLTACKDEKYESYDREGERYDYYLPDYVKVCNYKDIEVPDISYAPSEDDINNKKMQMAVYYAPRYEDPDRPCQKGDVVDIITTCKFTDNGQTYPLFNFERNDNDMGQSFLLGYNYFGFPELDEAVIGMEAGETKTVKLTLPDPFYNDYANSAREVEMEIYLNYIDSTDFSVANDEFFHEHFGYYGDSLREYIITELREDVNEKLEGYKEYITWNYICQNSKLKKVPEKEYNEVYESNLNSARTSAEAEGQTLLEYVKDYYGYKDLDEYYKNLKKHCEDICYEEMILTYIRRCENLKVSDEYYEKTVLKLAEPYDIKDYAEAENFLIYYYGAEQFNEMMLSMYTQNWIAENATVRSDIHQLFDPKLNK